MERIRRGKDSVVVDRISVERERAARETLERTIEARRLDRESRALGSEILDLSGDLKRALLDRARERDARAQDPTMKSIEQRQRAAAERWVEYGRAREGHGREHLGKDRTLILAADTHPDQEAKREKTLFLNRDGSELEL